MQRKALQLSVMLCLLSSLALACPLSITTSSLPNGTIGTAYSQFVHSQGGSSPYTWAITSGSLPTSLSLNTGTGQITGTPTVAGTFNFTIRVTDGGAKTASRALAIIIASSGMAITTSSPLPSGTQSVAYSAVIHASGGTTPYSWSITSGTINAGLSLNASTGGISGTPTTAATNTFSITGLDSSTPQQSASRSFSLTINAPTVSHFVVLNWTASTSSGVTGYRVYRNTVAGTPIFWASSSCCTFSDFSVSPATTYYYNTTAVNSGGESTYSNQATAVIP